MKQVASWSSEKRKELFSETAAKKGIAPALVEKDFWVCLVLSELFEDSQLEPGLLFKGGTSLSKVFGLIERFSEDIDIALDWKKFTDEDPYSKRSGSAQRKFVEEMSRKAREYISGEMLTRLQQNLDGICKVEVDDKDKNTLNVIYPAVFSSDYLRPVVRVEAGPESAWMPNGDFTLRSYAAEKFESQFKKADCKARTILAVRTFWEKATILHQEHHRSEEKSLSARYSRHYYDLYKMAKNPKLKADALAKPELLADVVAFKERFFPTAWARYDLADYKSLKLLPAAAFEAGLRQDYAKMKEMIYGEYPSWEEIIGELKALQKQINDH